MIKWNSDLPLSAAQLGVWYALKAGAPASAYNIGEYIRIVRAVDPALFETALRHVVSETEALRVRFVERDDIPGQLVDGRRRTGPDLPGCQCRSRSHRGGRGLDASGHGTAVDLHDGPFFAFALFKTEPASSSCGMCATIIW